MTGKESNVGKRLKKIRNRTGLSIRVTADALGWGHTKYQRYEDAFKKQFLPADMVHALVPIFAPHGIHPEELYELGGFDLASLGIPPLRSESKTIPEIDIRAGAGGGGFNDGPDRIISHWGLPEGYVRDQLNPLSFDKCFIIEISGDSMSPTLESGDRVLVDTQDKVPSGGIFAVWNGYGVVAKRLSPVQPATDPRRIKFLSDNPLEPDYELTEDEINVIGRIIWRAHRL